MTHIKEHEAVQLELVFRRRERGSKSDEERKEGMTGMGRVKERMKYGCVW